MSDGGDSPWPEDALVDVADSVFEERVAGADVSAFVPPADPDWEWLAGEVFGGLDEKIDPDFGIGDVESEHPVKFDPPEYIEADVGDVPERPAILYAEVMPPIRPPGMPHLVEPREMMRGRTMPQNMTENMTGDDSREGKRASVHRGEDAAEAAAAPAAVLAKLAEAEAMVGPDSEEFSERLRDLQLEVLGEAVERELGVEPPRGELEELLDLVVERYFDEGGPKPIEWSPEGHDRGLQLSIPHFIVPDPPDPRDLVMGDTERFRSLILTATGLRVEELSSEFSARGGMEVTITASPPGWTP